jgi:GNAT superfamily N-acetyltransferase
MNAIDYRIIAGRYDADIKALAAISVLDNGNPETLAEGIDYFRGELEQMDLGRRLLIGAFAGNELTGFVRFTLCERLGLWWCRGLVVAVEWQRRGIGATLLKTALQRLADRGERDIRSDTGENNMASQATHLRAGFVLASTDGLDFDGRRLENHPFYQWRKPL